MKVETSKWLKGSQRGCTASEWLSIVVAGLFLLSSSASGQNAGDRSSCESAAIITAASTTAETPALLIPAKDQRQAIRSRKKSYDINRVGNRGIGTGINFYSPGYEQELGRKLADKVEQSGSVIFNAEVTGYIANLAQRIVANSDAKMSLKVTVMLDDEVNAYSLPGGYLFVNSGLILKTDNEAQLAGILAHEIAHIEARHTTRDQTKELLFASTSPLIVVRPLLRFRCSRNAEREADLLGLQYQYLSGYDPHQWIRFLEKVEDRSEEPTFIGRAISSYPSVSERIKTAQKNIRLYLPDRDRYIVDTDRFEEMKSKVRQIVNASRKPMPNLADGVVSEIRQIDHLN